MLIVHTKVNVEVFLGDVILVGTTKVREIITTLMIGINL